MSTRGYSYKAVFYIAIVIYVIFGLAMVYLNDLKVTDENWHFAASCLVAEGKVPYRDFTYFHLPVMPYVYAIGMSIFGCDLIVARLISFFLGLLSVIFIYQAARRLSGEYAGIIAVFLILFNMNIMHNTTHVHWTAAPSFFLSLFCFCLVSSLRPQIKYSLCIALLLLYQGCRYLFEYMTVYTLIFVVFVILTNKKDKGVIAGTIISYVTVSLLICLPGLTAPRAFLFDTFGHNFVGGFLLTTGKDFGTDYNLLICIYDRLKLVLTCFRSYYIIILFSLLAGIYAYNHYTSLIKNRKDLLKVIIQHKEYFMFVVLIIFSVAFYLGMFGHHLPQLPYHTFPMLVILIGCTAAKLLEDFKGHKQRKFFTLFLFAAIGLNLLTQDIEANINAPQYAGVKFLNNVRSAIQRHTQPQNQVFSFMNGYVLHAGRQIFVDTMYDVSSVSLFPQLSDKEAQQHKLLSPNILLSYFRDRKAKAAVFEQPGRLEQLPSNLRDEVKKALAENYYLAEKVYRYPGRNIPEPVVYIYKLK